MVHVLAVLDSDEEKTGWHSQVIQPVRTFGRLARVAFGLLSKGKLRIVGPSGCAPVDLLLLRARGLVFDMMGFLETCFL